MSETSDRNNRMRILGEETYDIASDDAAAPAVCVATQVQAYKLAWDTIDVDTQVEYLERAVEIVAQYRKDNPRILRMPRYRR